MSLVSDPLRWALKRKGLRCAPAPCGRGHKRSAESIFAEAHVPVKND